MSSFKIDPPFTDFMQVGINTKMDDLVSMVEANINESPKTEIEEIEEIVEDLPTKKNYNIQPLFWLLQPKLLQKIDLEENETMFCTLNFNIDFGNLRLQLFNIEKESCIKRNVLFLNEMTSIIDGCIYPTDCFKIIHSKEIEFYAFENLVKFTNEDWQLTRPLVHITKNDKEIRLQIENHNGTIKSHYVFSDYQREIFLYCCKYVVTTGFQLVGMNKIKNI